MTSPPIIGLTGFKGSGKTYVAQLLASYFDYQPTSFAEPIKEMLSALVAYQGADSMTTGEMFYGNLKETPSPYLGGRTPRHAMQTLGTAWGRSLIEPELWVRVLLQRKESVYPYLPISIDDVRFPNEAAAIRQHGGKIIFIDRQDIKFDGHTSEREILNFTYDAVIYNYGTRGDLSANVRKIIETLQQV